MMMGMDEMGPEITGHLERPVVHEDVEIRLMPRGTYGQFLIPRDIWNPPRWDSRNIATKMVGDDPDVVTTADKRPRLFVYPHMTTAVSEIRRWCQHHDPKFSLKQDQYSPLAVNRFPIEFAVDTNFTEQLKQSYYCINVDMRGMCKN